MQKSSWAHFVRSSHFAWQPEEGGVVSVRSSLSSRKEESGPIHPHRLVEVGRLHVSHSSCSK